MTPRGQSKPLEVCQRCRDRRHDPKCKQEAFVAAWDKQKVCHRDKKKHDGVYSKGRRRPEGVPRVPQTEPYETEREDGKNVESSPEIDAEKDKQQEKTEDKGPSAEHENGLLVQMIKHSKGHNDEPDYKWASGHIFAPKGTNR